MIRLAQRRDVARMLEIYAYYVDETTISFEYEAPTLDEFMQRFDRITARFPWIVWEQEGDIVGYAYADVAFVRKAYQWDADLSIYLDKDARKQGIGVRLYDCIESMMQEMGYHTLYALITGANIPSCRFHEKRGYELEGVLKRSGYKFGKWHDVRWYALHCEGMNPDCGTPKPFEPKMLDAYIKLQI